MTRRAVLVALVVGALAVGCAGGQADSATLPDIELELVGGGSYAVVQTGTPRVLNLWAQWCAPCRAELPIFDQVAAEVDDVEIVGVNVGDKADDADQLIDELGLSFPQALDPDSQIYRALRIIGMPATVFIDEAGEVVEIHSGELNRAELIDLLGKHLGHTA